MPKKQMSAEEYTKKVYEESPYKNPERDRDMRNKLMAMTNNAGAGRGGQGGPTAKELQDYERKQDAGIWTEEKGPPPQEPDDASARPTKRMAKGGMTASKRADGCAMRGKTRGKMV